MLKLMSSLESKRLHPLMVLVAVIVMWGCMTFRYVGNGFSIALICFVLAFLFLSVRMRALPRIRLEKDFLRAIVVLYGSLFIIGLVQGHALQNTMGGAYSSVTLFMITLPLWMILYLGWERDLRKPIALTIYGNMYAFSIYGLYLYFTKHQSRFTSFYGSPPEVGMLLDLFIPFTAAIGVYYWRSRAWRAACCLLLPLEYVALLLSETRGSYLACSVGIVVVVAVWLGQYRWKISGNVKGAVCSGAILFCAFMGWYAFVLSAESAVRMQGGERPLMWEMSYRMWDDHKLLGIGLDRWAEVYNEPGGVYHPKTAKETTNVMTHNIYLHFLATGGLAAFAALLGYIFFMIRYLFCKVMRQRANPFTWAMLFMFVALMAHGMVDGTLISKHIGRIFYLLMGAAILWTERYQDMK